MGGVGGVHLLTLARLGIGSFSLADPDAFERDNLNRQSGALVSTLGATKLPFPPAAAHAASQPGTVQLAVCGAHLSGLPLNHQLTERGARLVRACRTAPSYKLYALAGFTPPRPGMIRESGGRRIEVEV